MSYRQKVRSFVNRPIWAGLFIVLAMGSSALFFAWWNRVLPLRQHLEAALTFIQMGEGGKAEEELKAALRIDPDYTPAIQVLAEYYMTNKQWLRSIEALQQLRKLSPNEPHVECRLAACYLPIQDDKSAYESSITELKHDPDCLVALTIASVLLGRMHQEKQHLTHLRRLAELRPSDTDIQMLLAEALNEAHDADAARRALRRVLQLNPDHAGAHGLLGISYLEDANMSDSLDRAKTELYKSLRMNPLNGGARQALGRVYLRQHKPVEAIFQLTEAADLMPESYFVFLELSRAYEAAGNKERAGLARKRFLMLREMASRESILAKRCAAFPKNADYHFQLGSLKLSKGDYRDAFYYLNRARSLRPNHAATESALEVLGRLTGVSPHAPSLEQKMTESAGALQSSGNGSTGQQATAK